MPLTQPVKKRTRPFVTAEPGADHAGGRVSDADGHYAGQKWQQAPGIWPRVDPQRQRTPDQQVNRREGHRSLVFLVRVYTKTSLQQGAQWRHICDTQSLWKKKKKNDRSIDRIRDWIFKTFRLYSEVVEKYCKSPYFNSRIDYSGMLEVVMFSLLILILH